DGTRVGPAGPSEADPRQVVLGKAGLQCGEIDLDAPLDPGARRDADARRTRGAQTRTLLAADAALELVAGQRRRLEHRVLPHLDVELQDGRRTGAYHLVHGAEFEADVAFLGAERGGGDTEE